MQIANKTKKQIVVSRIIYEYILSGISDSIQSLSHEEMQAFVMRINMQAITHAIELCEEEQLNDFTYTFEQLGVNFSTIVPLSDVELTPEYIDEHMLVLQNELDEDFGAMVEYIEKLAGRVA